MEWKPISEAPKDGSFVDLWDGGGRFPKAWWDDGWIYVDEYGCSAIAHNPTHFMIVEPPKDGA